MALNTLSALKGAVTPAYEYGQISGSAKGASTCMHSRFFGTAANTGTAAAPASGLAGATRSQTTLPFAAGLVPFRMPGGANTSYLIGREIMVSTGQKADFTCDRLWDNSGIVVTTTTAQTINSVAWPARDLNASTNGTGVFIALEVTTATTNAAAITNMTISYTNEAGTAGRTGTVLPVTGFPATAPLGSFVLFDLQSGDFGVRSVQSITLGTSLVTGAVSLVAFRPIIGFQNGSLGLLQTGRRRAGLFRCWKAPFLSGCFPFILHDVNATTTGIINQKLIFAEG